MGKKNKGQRRAKQSQKRKKKSATPRSTAVSLRQVPDIIGAEFRHDGNDIEALQAKIDELQPSLEGQPKRRILYITEASYLRTGFSTYLREVMLRLQSTGKYELAEFGSYGHSPIIDPRAKEVPWKYYHNMPETGVEEQAYQKDYKENQFGKWKLPYVLSDFQPDIILLNRDNWMDTHVLKNSLRGNCLVFWMPTVDGFPQKWNWLQDYSKVDGLFTYSWFGKKVLEQQSRSPLAKRYNLKQLEVSQVCQPGVNCDVFKPLPKDQVRKVFGMVRPEDQKKRFVGTVMRNQPRKLFTRIIESFRMFREQHPDIAQDVFLLLHTSIPDVGWDIPEWVRQNGLEEWVVFTYLCRRCGNMAISNFRGSPTNCPVCHGDRTFQTPNTQFGLEPEQFNYIFNMLDVYIQGSIAEGDGMPVNEAKAAGVPVLASDYSALYEKARNGGAIPIENDSFYTEHETGQNRSLFCRQDLCDKLAHLLSNEADRLKLASEARQCAVTYYTWDLCAKKWELAIDSAEIKDRSKTWEGDIELKSLPEERYADDNELSDKEFIEQCYLNIVSGKKPDADGMRTWSQALEKSGPPGTDGNKKCRAQLEAWFRQKVEKENDEKKLKANPTAALVNPVDRIKPLLDESDTFRILYAIPETFGDVFVSTGVINSLKKLHPNASIYVATQEKHFGILKDNPDVHKCIPYEEAMLNYRTFEKWGPAGNNLFDIVFNPYIVTQKIPHWIHNGYGPWLGQAYANLCNVDFGQMFLAEDDSLIKDLPEEYMTVQSTTRTDPKDYDFFEDVLEKVNFPIVQVGGRGDKPIEKDGVIDLRGKTSPQQLASVLKKAKLHFGGDSFPMHVAGYVGTPSVILFGGTYAKQGYNPAYAPHVRAIETQDRGPCATSCHLLECEAKKRGFDKCINNIPVERVIQEITEILGEDHVEQLEPLKISAYTIIKNGVKNGFPFKEAIRAAAAVADEVVVVDGGSDDETKKELWDLTMEFLEPVGIKEKSFYGKLPPETPLSGGSGWGDLQCDHCEAKYRLGSGDLIGDVDWKCECGKVTEHRSYCGDSLKHSKIKVYEHAWDMDNPTLFGDEKTYSRRLCTGTHLIQFDCDELIHEPKPGMIRDLVRRKRFLDVIDLPVVNFYGDTETIRVENNFWKWRITRNDPRIIHGVHGAARIMDPETGRITMDKRKSDACEYIYEDNLEICQHRLGFNADFLAEHERLKAGATTDEEYLKKLHECVESEIVVFHYSWLDLNRKEKNGEFWDQTWHGKRKATHNTTENIKGRVAQRENEKLLTVEFEHPFKHERATT